MADTGSEVDLSQTHELSTALEGSSSTEGRQVEETSAKPLPAEEKPIQQKASGKEIGIKSLKSGEILFGITKEFNLGHKTDRALFERLRAVGENIERLEMLREEMPELYRLGKEIIPVLEERATKIGTFSAKEQQQYRIFQSEEEIIVALQLNKWDIEAKLRYLARDQSIAGAPARLTVPSQRRINILLEKAYGFGLVRPVLFFDGLETSVKTIGGIAQWVGRGLWRRPAKELELDVSYQPTEFDTRVVSPYIQEYIDVYSDDPEKMMDDLVLAKGVELAAYQKIGLEELNEAEISMLSFEQAVDPSSTIGQLDKVAYHTAKAVQQLLERDFQGKDIAQLTASEQADIAFKAQNVATARVCSELYTSIVTEDIAAKGEGFGSDIAIIKQKAKDRRGSKGLDITGSEAYQEAEENLQQKQESLDAVDRAFKEIKEITWEKLPTAQKSRRIAKRTYDSLVNNFGSEVTHQDHVDLGNLNEQLGRINEEITDLSNAISQRPQNVGDLMQRREDTRRRLTVIQKQRDFLQSKIDKLTEAKSNVDTADETVQGLVSRRQELDDAYFVPFIEGAQQGQLVADEARPGILLAARREARTAQTTIDQLSPTEDREVVMVSPEADALDVIANMLGRYDKIMDLSQKNCKAFIHRQNGYDNLLRHLFGYDKTIEELRKILPRSEIAGRWIEFGQRNPLSLKTADGSPIFASEDELQAINTHIVVINQYQSIIGKITTTGSIENINFRDLGIYRRPKNTDEAIEVLNKKIITLRQQDQAKLELAYDAIAEDLGRNVEKTRLFLGSVVDNLKIKGLEGEPFASSLELEIRETDFTEERVFSPDYGEAEYSQPERSIRRWLTTGNLEIHHGKLNWEGEIAGLDGTQVLISADVETSDIAGAGQLSYSMSIRANLDLWSQLPERERTAIDQRIPPSIRGHFYTNNGRKKAASLSVTNETIPVTAPGGRQDRNFDRMLLNLSRYWRGSEIISNFSASVGNRFLLLTSQERVANFNPAEFRAVHFRGLSGNGEMRLVDYAVEVSTNGNVIIQGRHGTNNRFSINEPLGDFIRNYKQRYMEANNIENEEYLTAVHQAQIETDLKEIYRKVGREALRSIQKY